MRGYSLSYILPATEVVSSSNAVVTVVTSSASMAKPLKHSVPSRNARYYSWNDIKHEKMTSVPCDSGEGSSRLTPQNSDPERKERTIFRSLPLFVGHFSGLFSLEQTFICQRKGRSCGRLQKERTEPEN